MAPLYASETDRWSSTLEWDTARDWEEVERGRVLGTVSGLVVTDKVGATAGWSYYLIHNRALQVGSFIASSDPAAQLMLDTILRDDIRGAADTVTFFAFTEAQGLAAALRQRGLSTDRYWYLGRELERQAPPRIPNLRRWRDDDFNATAELLGRAYEGADETRPFAPKGTSNEWSEYVKQLTKGTGCGALIADACICVPDGPNRLLAVALVTRISETGAHLAQLAVDPQARGQGVGRQLLATVCAAASLAACRRITLFVGGRNSRARSLYESSRFEIMASFLSAGTLQPRRSTSVAPGGAAITRR